MSEITRRWEEALTDLAEHYDRAMTRQAEQNAQLQRQVKGLARGGQELAATGRAAAAGRRIAQTTGGRLAEAGDELGPRLRWARECVARAIELIREALRRERFRGPSRGFDMSR